MDRASGIAVAVLTAALIAAAPACAQGIDVDARATLTSDYRFRGLSQSDRDPALQASVDFQAPTGLFAGGFASTVDGALLGGADAEVDLYAGYARRSSSGVHVSIGAFGYFYPGGEDVNYGEVQGEIGYLIGPADATLFAAYAPDQHDLGDNLYLGGSLGAGIPLTPLSAKLKLGYEDGFYDGKWDWEAGVSYAAGPVTLAASYVDTDQDGRPVLGRLGSAGVIASLSVGF
jgi:uncharacterized protein (TIGR02001 family)